ncbi:MAG: Cof-type HAD-IIB family hydrolase [Bacteroidales bacterium]|nr:Cof-type HAD-IIB family hydrolase [Bacteroidales bacterium]
MSTNWEMIITDLDGTLLNNNREVSLTDMKTLFWLGENNIIRVIATGRNFFSLRKVLKDNFPIDYLIFSSGAGVYDWKNKTLMHSQYMPDYEVRQISEILINHNVDFMIHEMIPENHKFVYHRSGNHNPDFERRIKIYNDFAIELNPKTESYQHACQIIAVFPNNISLFDEIKQKFSDIKIIRTTSPLDGDSIWMEIFPEIVSKGYGIDWLCNELNIDPVKTISIGNDYNDIDMLEYTAEKFVVDNAPDDLKEKFPVCKSNQENGFTDVVLRFFDVFHL